MFLLGFFYSRPSSHYHRHRSRSLFALISPSWRSTWWHNGLLQVFGTQHRKGKEFVQVEQVAWYLHICIWLYTILCNILDADSITMLRCSFQQWLIFVRKLSNNWPNKVIQGARVLGWLCLCNLWLTQERDGPIWPYMALIIKLSNQLLFLFETAAPALARYDNYDAARAMDPNEAAGKCECGQCGLSHSRVIPSSSLP